MSDSKKFAQMLPGVDHPPPQDVQALGHMLRDWLASVVADAGTEVDVGGGMGCFDLWVRMGGKEVFITIQQR